MLDQLIAIAPQAAERARQAYAERVAASGREPLETFRARLRVRLGKPLGIEENRREVVVGDMNVRLMGYDADQPISKSQWLILGVYDQPTAEAAWLAGRRLAKALSLAAIEDHVGVDLGDDRPTSMFSAEIANVLKSTFGVALHPNVHGVAVYPEDEIAISVNVNASATVIANGDKFVQSLDQATREVDGLDERARVSLELLNAAMMATDSVARIILGLSAVEFLGQDAKWSAHQLRLLTRFEAEARSFTDGDSAENDEVADAIRRSMYRVSLRQGVMRTLARIGLADEKKTWDRLYGLRSELVHGTTRRPVAEIVDLATQTMSLCRKIVLTYAHHTRQK